MYDYHISGNLEECVNFAEKLGWKGVCYVIDWERFDEERKKAIKMKKADIDIALGILINSQDIGEIKRLVDKFRSKVELVFVRGGNTELNRYLFDIPKIDVVSGVSGGSLDYVMCRLAKENNIAIEFSFTDVLHSYSKTRSRVFSNFLKNAKIIRKYKSPFVITSGALSKWDMRSPHDLMVFGKTIGFQDPEIKASFSDDMINEARKMLSKKKVMRGVEEI